MTAKQRLRGQIHRYADWQTRLSAYLTRCNSNGFKYGHFDCGLFVAGAIETIRRIDVAAPLRGKYTTRTEAFAAIKELCGSPTMESIAAYLAKVNGIVEVPVLCAQRGDAVVLKHGRRSTLGIIAMHGTEVLTPYRHGLLRIPLDKAQVTHAYRI